MAGRTARRNAAMIHIRRFPTRTGMTVRTAITTIDVSIGLLVTSRAGGRDGTVIHPDVAPLGGDVAGVTGISGLDVVIRLLVATGAS